MFRLALPGQGPATFIIFFAAPIDTLGNLSNNDGNAKDDGSKKMDLNFKL